MISAFVQTAAATTLGAATWSAGEYFIHQYLGHRFAKNRNPFAKEHVRHHATTSYFAATSKKVAAAVGAVVAVAPLASYVAGPWLGGAFTLGFVATYAGYEILHRTAHTHAPTTAYGRWLRRHHFYHHFHNPAANHGVTSPLWDHIMGTHQTPSRIVVPKKHAMPWLLDPQTGEVLPKFQDDYELKARKHPPRATAEATTAAIPATGTPGPVAG